MRVAAPNCCSRDCFKLKRTWVVTHMACPLYVITVPSFEYSHGGTVAGSHVRLMETLAPTAAVETFGHATRSHGPGGADPLESLEPFAVALVAFGRRQQPPAFGTLTASQKRKDRFATSPSASAQPETDANTRVPAEQVGQSTSTSKS